MAATVLQQIVNRGATVPHPRTVVIGDDVRPERLAPDITILPGCRIEGSATSIGPGSVLGADGPVTLKDSQLGHGVSIGSGSVAGATLLDGVTIGPGAHIRPGTLLEEQASCGHSVGLKQTLLMPFVTMGSLINFCDCLMAGGTSRRNHSEVGSSYVHFNFTPRQDKATPSTIGDVPRGVMLDQPPIFLGGQGGLVGPARVAYGTVVAAGVVRRGDILKPDSLVYGCVPESAPTDFQAGYNQRFARKVANNLNYLGNLHALLHWYRCVRIPFMRPDPFRHMCHAGAVQRIETMIDERIRRLDEFADKPRHSLDADPAQDTEAKDAQTAFARNWQALRRNLTVAALSDAARTAREAFLSKLTDPRPGGAYLDAVQAWPPETRQSGTRWLQAVVDHVTGLNPAHPSIRGNT